MQDEEFDWVGARADCSAEKVFQAIKLGVEADILRRNGLRKEGEPYKFGIISRGLSFAVFVEGNKINASLTLEPSAKGIQVRSGDDQTVISGMFTVNDPGGCRLRVKDQELNLWQFRKRALEGIFFETV